MSTWDQLESICLSCRRCPLAETRTHVVFGTGPQSAEIMFIGEGPGESEDLQGEPFVGRAGHLLDDMLSLIGLNRSSNVYIANVVKCRPPQNRDPLASEQNACMDYLRGQIVLIDPKIIVCLGRISAAKLIHEDYKITREHGQWVRKSGIWMTAIYHPAALLRDPSKKPDTFVDLRSIREKIQEACTKTVLLPIF